MLTNLCKNFMLPVPLHHLQHSSDFITSSTKKIEIALSLKRVLKQDHLRMNIAPDINNHLRGAFKNVLANFGYFWPKNAIFSPF